MQQYTNKKLNEDPRTFKTILFTGLIMVTFVTMVTYYGYFDAMVVMSMNVATDFLITLVTKVASVPIITLATVLIKVTKVRWSLRQDDSISNVSLLRKFLDPFRCLTGRHKRDSQLCSFNLPDLDRNTAQ
jgi:hypothetical protein